jgi:hypothetical protein
MKLDIIGGNAGGNMKLDIIGGNAWEIWNWTDSKIVYRKIFKLSIIW